ncbi:MAG: hypothetical protein HY051_02440 [Candidatus Aenigmarchaeota archaeon]|nr:hypothetical protein [Candidatus Aenigmarchaeota archaeon]
MVDYFQYVAVSSLVSALIILHELKDFKRYVALGMFTVFCALFAEPLGKLMGFWDYYTGPYFFGANVFIIANYFNYIIIVYFASEKFRRGFFS